MRSCTLLTLSLLGLAVALGPTAAHADFMSSFCGSTRAEGTLGAGVDGTISFAVVDVVDDPLNVKEELLAFTFVPGLNSGGFDDSARYVYLYQAVNDGPNTSAISDITVGLSTVQSTEISSWGYFDGLSLSDAQGAVGQPGGLADNRLNAFGDIDDAAFAELAAASTGVTQPGFNTTLTDLEMPLLIRVSDPGAEDNFTATFDPIHNYNQPNFRSTVIAFTTNAPPDFDTVNFQNGGGQAMGTVASPVPEPSTGVLAAIGFVGLLAHAWRKRRRR